MTDASRQFVHVGDCLDVMPTLEACSVDAIVTDPPYGLGFMGKGWDHAVPGEPFWREALRVAKPGAFLAAFGGTRTFHRMACAIEDAGWELRDTLMWVYGSGFPKSHNGEWGGTALKPAWEPIVLARKPLVGTVEANWREHGTGALNIDGCRVPVDPEDPVNDAQFRCAPSAFRDGTAGFVTNNKPGDVRSMAPPKGGRWPANLVHDGSDEVLACFPNATGQQRDTGPEFERNAHVYGKLAGVVEHRTRGDSGSAARFFYCAKADRADRNDGCDEMPQQPSYMVENGSRTAAAANGVRYDRTTVHGNNHPTVKPTELMRWLCRLVTPPGGLILDPFTGSGSTGRGAILEGFQFVGVELSEEYAEIARARIAAAVEQRRIDTMQGGLFGEAA